MNENRSLVELCCIKQRFYITSFNSEVRVEGLETLDYLDNLQHRERFTEQGTALTFESEVKNDRKPFF